MACIISPSFNNHPDAVYSRLIYAAKSTDVAHVMCNGRWLMRDRELLTVDEAAAKAEAAQVAAQIDAFVRERESSPYNKLVLLSGVQRQESFEIQVKVPIADDASVLRGRWKATSWKSSNTPITSSMTNTSCLTGTTPTLPACATAKMNSSTTQGEVYQARSRLTLIGEEERQAVPQCGDALPLPLPGRSRPHAALLPRIF